MIIYYNTQNDEVFAIAEHDVIIPPHAAIVPAEYNGEIPKDIIFALFNGKKFYSKPEIECELLSQAQINKESQAVLARTDWYVIRQIETGKQVPKEIKEARYFARSRIRTPEEILKGNTDTEPTEPVLGGMSNHGMKRA